MPYLRCNDTLRQSSTDVPIRKPLVTIGRMPGNDVVLDDQAVGATHANLLRSGDGTTINAVDAKAEIYVNGKRVRTAAVVSGDKILIGRFELEMHDGAPPTQSPSIESSTESLQRLVEFASQLMREESPERLFKQLLESVVSLTGAEKGFVIVLRDGERQVAAAHNVVDDQSDLSRVSDTIIDQLQHQASM